MGVVCLMSWSYTAGDYGNKVTVFERTPGGIIQCRWSENGQARCKSLKHRIKARARNHAHSLSDRLAGGAGSGSARVCVILSEYVKHKTPGKSGREQYADARRAALFSGQWGISKPSDITLLWWDRFIKERFAGGAGPRTIEADLKWFNSVLNWATKWATDHGYLLDENPVRGYPIPHEKNPHQPVMTQDQLEQFFLAAHPDMKDLLLVANETGRRLSAILGLKWDDVNFGSRTITWREDTDKQGKKSHVPMTDGCTRLLALRRETYWALDNPTGYVFPAPRDPSKPMHRNRAQAWAEQTAEKAGIPWPGWHSIRRKWVSERPSTQAVAQAGGWANLRTMLMCYNKPDMEAMREAVEQRTPYREAR